MENSKQNLDGLIDKYLTGEATSEERDLLERAYMNATMRHQVIEVEEDQAEHITKIGKDSWAQLVVRINQSSARRLILWPRIAVVAAAVAAIVFGVWFFTTSRHHDPSGITLSLSKGNDLAPGHQGAILTLASGKQIRLSDVANGEVTKEAGISVTKTADGQLVYQIKEAKEDPGKINTLTTAKGETYIVTLSDQSKVWLNAASSLTYSTALTVHGQRKVKLEGEAYFEVAKDKKHPFIVESRGQEVEVLGTHFNINAYGDEPAIATTLLEGSVRITYASRHPELVSGPRISNQNVILKPGEQAINNGNKIKVAKANLESVIDWKKGDFVLDGINFKVAMRKIARWYNVEIVYDPSVPDNITSGGWISRNTKLSEVLALIEKSGQVQFKIDDNKIYVFINPKK